MEYGEEKHYFKCGMNNGHAPSESERYIFKKSLSR